MLITVTATESPRGNSVREQVPLASCTQHPDRRVKRRRGQCELENGIHGMGKGRERKRVSKFSLNGLGLCDDTNT